MMATQQHAYSVWAIPPEDVRKRVKNLMDNLRSEFGGPEFDPHITVVKAVTLTPEDALDRFRSACKGVKPYTVRATAVHTGTCVSLLFDTTPQVVETSDHCCSIFGSNRAAPKFFLPIQYPLNSFQFEAKLFTTNTFAAYKPHMSLLYADLTEEEMKKAEERATVLDDTIANLSFIINRLALYLTDEDKTLKSWKKVAEYELQSI